MMEVAENTVVSLRYCMKNSQGEVLENRLNAAPVKYLHGSKSIMPALQQGLTGMKAGDKTYLTISNEMDFRLDTSFYFDVVIDAVRIATDEEIKLGKPVNDLKKEDCGPDCACYS
ncbi:MAG TPA: FKBP-type peptidyl-prolyl cis-trans isomerase [Chitinophagaceae bacterium]|nr:FKBP-type peptidyl-prolyl cis-trans isomerase [Chitinophagaceae bacterium]